MKYNSKKPKKFVVGGALAAAQLGLGLGQSIFGAIQRNQANKALRELQRNRPAVEVSEATKRLADSPIAREQMDYERDALKRNTADSLNALQAGGGRSVLAGVGGVSQREMQGTRDLTSRYEQARRNALALLGQEQRRVQDINQNIWQNQVAATRAEKGAGQQNIFGGATAGAKGLGYLGELALGNDPSMLFGGGNRTTQTPQGGNELDLNTELLPNQNPYGTSLFPQFGFKDGGKVPSGEDGFKTEGEFSHSKNPLKIVNKKGEVVGEATGKEYILNPEQMDKASKESKFMRYLKKKFNKEAK